MGFSLDSPVMEKGGRISDLLIVNVLWLVCSLPLVTLGAADGALYYTIVKVVRRQRGAVFSAFFHSLRCNLRQGLIVTLFYLGYGILLAICIFMGRNLPESQTVLAMAGVILSVPCLVLLPWIFTVISRFEVRLGTQIQYAFHMAIRHFPTTLLLLLMLTITVAAVAVLPVSILFLPGLYTLLASFLKERVLRMYMREKREPNENPDELPWYLE